ncbi:isochorismatase family protein [Kitasatospora sp. NA04385]|uniref:isochorismatase family protein n=1 Tax=Kitasatospora sp. NA04385 TaxID=2742135 RepID=UPI00159289EB|nr:isochorismatase family protein [Kitasatospora sp. NA04385]QKW18404.1 isochorismatase family protein [Kitasatospora sp. NA04385]
MSVTALDPTTALVVIDLQQSILALPTAPYPAREVLERGIALAGAFRAAKLPVVLVRVSFAADGGDVPPGRTEQNRGGGGATTRPEGWDRISEELLAPSDLVVTKHNWGAFHGTDLDVQLRRRGVTQIVLAGVATSIGVESTARAAHEHGYHVTLAVDAMSDLDADAHHNSVRRIFPRLGETGTTEEVLALLAATR